MRDLALCVTGWNTSAAGNAAADRVSYDRFGGAGMTIATMHTGKRSHSTTPSGSDAADSNKAQPIF
jgi:hypothetical protein